MLNSNNYFTLYSNLQYVNSIETDLVCVFQIKENTKLSILVQMKQKIRSAVHAWKLYFRSSIRDAGFALSSLYMTVLAFDNYSRGKTLKVT